MSHPGFGVRERSLAAAVAVLFLGGLGGAVVTSPGHVTQVMATTPTAAPTTVSPMPPASPVTPAATAPTTAAPTRAPAPSAPPTTRPVPSLGGSILFISNRGSPPPKPTTGPVIPSSNGYNIWVMGPDGRNQRPLTRTGHDAQPALSPDGRRVAWVVANNQLWTMSSDGSAAAQVASCPLACGTPRWSPDGTRIAYATMSRTRGDVVIIMADGSRPRRYSGVNAYSVAWSPDSTRLAIGGSAEKPGLWVMNVASGDQSTVRTGNSFAPSWSPDGRLILVSDGAALLTLFPSANGVRPLISGRGQYLGGSWSADGRTIAFDYFPGIVGVHQQVWTMHADGTGARALTDGSTQSYEATY